MIYIIAPYSLKINTTSRNRILSFYHALNKHGEDVTIISPPSLVSLKKWYHQSGENASDVKVIYLPERGSGIVKFVASKSNRKLKALFFLFKSIFSPLLLSRYFKGASHEITVEGVTFTEKDIVICSYPSPVSLTLAKQIIDQYQCKLLLDYRDPWTYGYNHVDTPFVVEWSKKKFERSFENFLLQKASAITVISDILRNYFPSSIQDKTILIKNGANSFYIRPEKIQAVPNSFNLVYLGTIYNEQLKEDVFFKALSRLIDDKKIQPPSFLLEFVGPNNSFLADFLAKFKLEPYIKIHPNLSIGDALGIGYNASAFFHLRYGKADSIYTSKHADYLALQKPIILPVSDNGVLASSILENNAGYVCNNMDECYAALEELWEKHQKKESFKIPRSKEFLYNISREAEAEKLVSVIKKLQE